MCKKKSILISIQPQWVEKILNGEKTIEIRKTMPKEELPCKVYIYCTQSKPYILDNRKYDYLSNKYDLINYCLAKYDKDALNGKVVAEFTLNKIEILWQNNKNKTSTATVVDKAIFEKQTCMTWEQYCEYHKCKNGKYSNSYAWHIDDLKIYDVPKELSEFYKNNHRRIIDDLEFNGCDEKHCKFAIGNSFIGDDGYCDYSMCPKLRLTRPPQSWCYVESLEVEDE